MRALKRYVVPVNLIVLGENANDAKEYVEDALEQCDLLTQDGIQGIDPYVDVDAIELAEEEYDKRN